jgi:hypothetical protein
MTENNCWCHFTRSRYYSNRGFVVWLRTLLQHTIVVNYLTAPGSFFSDGKTSNSSAQSYH